MYGVLTKLIGNRIFYNINRLPSLLNVTVSVLYRSNNISTTMFKSAVFDLKDAEKEQVTEFLDSFDTVLSDCDGKKNIEKREHLVSNFIKTC